MLIWQVARLIEYPLLDTAPLVEETLLLGKVKNKVWLQEVEQKRNLEL